MIWLYNIFIFLYSIAIRIAAFWNPKAKQWIEGRKDVWNNLRDNLPESTNTVWFHASSAGELEQAKPLIKAIKESFPSHKILISIYSPSGYRAARNYAYADFVFYLPLDTKRNANRLLTLIRPQLVVVVKYDYWYHLLKSICAKNIHLILVSAVFRESQPFFKWYGSLYNKMLSFFNQLFVQDATSMYLLQKLGISTGHISGDTRFDRVSEIAEDFMPLAFIKEFIGNNKAMIAGSTWPDDEELIKDVLANFVDIKFIIAPHEINATHLNQLKRTFPQAIFYSELKSLEIGFTDVQVLIIDNVGMLSRLYYYGDIAFIGGGFTKSGIHNALEAAVFGKPVIFGPNYQKYSEAVSLIDRGGAYSVSTKQGFTDLFNTLISDSNAYQQAGTESLNYIREQRGATKKILSYIQENRLLTS